jgi:hypothetical protein
MIETHTQMSLVILLTAVCQLRFHPLHPLIHPPINLRTLQLLFPLLDHPLCPLCTPLTYPLLYPLQSPPHNPPSDPPLPPLLRHLTCPLLRLHIYLPCTVWVSTLLSICWYNLQHSCFNVFFVLHVKTTTIIMIIMLSKIINQHNLHQHTTCNKMLTRLYPMKEVMVGTGSTFVSL